MLTVVEDQQEVLLAQRSRDAIGGDRTGAERETDGGRDGDRDEGRIGERSELDEPHAVGKPRQQPPRSLQRQSRLAHTTGAGQGHEAVRRDQIHHGTERGVPPDQIGKV